MGYPSLNEDIVDRSGDEDLTSGQSRMTDRALDAEAQLDASKQRNRELEALVGKDPVREIGRRNEQIQRLETQYERLRAENTELDRKNTALEKKCERLRAELANTKERHGRGRSSRAGANRKSGQDCRGADCLPFELLLRAVCDLEKKGEVSTGNAVLRTMKRLAPDFRFPSYNMRRFKDLVEAMRKRGRIIVNVEKGKGIVISLPKSRSST